MLFFLVVCWLGLLADLHVCTIKQLLSGCWGGAKCEGGWASMVGVVCKWGWYWVLE